MSLFLANCTKQTMRFTFRVPEMQKLICEEILSGRQAQLDRSMSFSPEQLASVIDQMEVYGFRNVTDLNRKMEDFDGMVFSTNKPLSSTNIQVANESLVEKQEKRSAQEATNAAYGFEKGTRDKRTGARLARVTAVEIKQDLDPKQQATGKEIGMNIEMSVDGSDVVKI